MKTIHILIALCFSTLTTNVSATLYIQGGFESSFSGTAVTEIYGTYSAEFDDSILTGSGGESFSNQAILTDFFLSPNPLGTTTFDTSNVFLDLRFNDGFLRSVVIGAGSVSGIAGNSDDFAFTATGSAGNSFGDVVVGQYSIATESGIKSSVELDGFYTSSTTPPSVPAPSLVQLLISAILAMSLPLLPRYTKKKIQHPSAPTQLSLYTYLA